MTSLIALLLLTQAPAPAVSVDVQPEPGKRKVLVMDLRADNVDAASVRTIQSTLTTELSRVPGLEVLSGDDVKNLVKLEAERQASGCDVDGSCLAEIAGALGADSAVFGDVGRLGALYIINLSVLDTKAAQSVGRTGVKVEALDRLPDALLAALPELLGPLLGPQGLLAYQQAIEARRTTPLEIKLAPKEGPPIYVVEPKLVGIAASVGATVSSQLAKTLEEEGLAVFTRDDAKVVIDQAADLALLGADADGASLSELGKRVGVQHVLACIVSSIDDDIVVQARLIDVQKAAVVSRREARASQFAGSILPTIEAAAQLVVAPIFSDEKGQIVLTVSEEGANVRIDDAIVGTAPLGGPLMLSGGHHLVQVEKEGFIQFAESIKMSRGAVIQRAVVLRPSVEYLEKYRFQNGALRASAWTGTVATAVGVPAAIGLWIGLGVNNQRIIDIQDKWEARADPVTGKLRTDEEYDAKNKEENDAILASQVINYVAVSASIVATVGLALAVGGWVLGDDPGKYDELDP